MDERRPWGVGELTARIRGALSSTPDLEDALVEGEVSNISFPVSGHIYFTLKDASAALKCVAFRTQAQRIPFRPENGMTVIAHGRIDIYDQGGTYQLYVDRLDPSGVGALALAVEQTRRRLAAEGLLDAGLKRPLPLYPRRVVVVTSRTGAAWRDVCTVIRRRAPGVEIILSPATVQGDNAVEAVVTALQRAARVQGADVLLLVRGGGSLEDLMAFNDERVARAVRASPTPVVTGIGHQTDLCIADLVADHQAATPSAAAEVAVPLASQLLGDIAARSTRLGAAARAGMVAKGRHLERRTSRLGELSPTRRVAGLRQDTDRAALRLRAALAAELASKRRRLVASAGKLELASPIRRLPELRQAMARRSDRLEGSAARLVPQRAAALTSRRHRLEALSPRRVLERGYSITLGPNGIALTAPGSTSAGTRLRTILAEGELQSVVENREEPTTEDNADSRPQ